MASCRLWTFAALSIKSDWPQLTVREVESLTRDFALALPKLPPSRPVILKLTQGIDLNGIGKQAVVETRPLSCVTSNLAARADNAFV